MRRSFGVGGRMFTSTVARRGFALFIACALVPVSALAIVTLHQVTTQLQEQAQRRLRQTSKGIGLTILHRLVAAEAELGQLSARGGSAPAPGARFAAATMIQPDGTATRLFGEMSLPELDASERARLASGKAVLSVASDHRQRARVVISRAVDPNRPDRGLIHGLLDLDSLWAIEEEGVLPAGCHLMVLDHTGRVLFFLADSEAPAPDQPILPATPPGGGHFTWRDGATTYVAARWALFLQPTMGVPNWTVVVSQSQDEVLAPIVTFKRVFLLVLVLTFLIVLLLSAQQIRRHLTPLAQLKDAARQIAHGDLTPRVRTTSRDEFAEVATAFNDMADQLDRQFHALALRHEITAAVSPTQSLDEFLGETATALVRHLDLAAVSIWLPDRGPTAFTRRASMGWPESFNGIPAPLPLTPAELARITVHHEPVVCSGADLHRPALGWAVGARIAGLGAHPLVVEGRLLGIVCAVSTRPFEAGVLGTLAVAAADVGRGIDRLRVDEALRDAEMQTRQLQKMEAVGRLAGGIAHDFNNLLTVITGRTYLMMNGGMTSDHPHWKSISTIDATAQRAASVTRQLLAFSRKQVLAPAVLDLNEVVAGMQDILHRLIGASIELAVSGAADLGRSRLDRSQVEQVLMNLVVNARDAMPEGGRIVIGTANVDLDDTFAREDRMGTPGPHVMIAVSDTGCGMDEQTRARIFEPFFTTKEVGKGTGLGLATVLGIVQQSGGHIRVDSEVGIGTTFRIYFPRLASEAVQVDSGALEKPRGGTETVLLVDDEQEVQAVLKAGLAEWGYTVLATISPTEALGVAAHYSGPIHVLLTDLVMPEMSGRVLAQQLAKSRPGITALYMSGHSDSPVGNEPDAGRFLQKPFSPDVAARAIRDVLDRPPAPGMTRASGRVPLKRQE